MRTLLAILFITMFSVSCGGGGSSENDNQTDTTPNNNNTTNDTNTPTFDGFDFNFSEGDFWEFGWNGTVTRWAQGSGSSTSEQGSSFRITLGAASAIDSIMMYGINLSGNPMWGDSQDFTPRWTHIGIDGNKIYGSTNGTTVEVVFDSESGVWSGGGFFSEFPSDTLIVATQGTITNDYITDSNAIRVGRSSSQDQCEVILGITICGDESFNRTEWEYFKSGLGPLGYQFYHSWSFSGGSFSSGGSDDYDMGLTASSLRGDSVDYTLEIEPNNTVATAMPLSLPASIHGDSLSEGDEFYGGSTGVILNSIDEVEPNNSDGGAQNLTIPVLIRGTIDDGDSGTLTTSSPPGFTSYQTSMEDWFNWANDPQTLRFFLEYDAASGADLDLMVGGLNFFDAYSVKDNVGSNDYTEEIILNSGSQTSGTYRVVIDAYQTTSGPVDYTLRVDTYDGSGFANEADIVDWFQIDLATDQDLSIEVTGGPSVVLMDSTGSMLIEIGLPLTTGGNASIQNEPLSAGQYLIGVSDEAVEYSLSVTSQ